MMITDEKRMPLILIVEDLKEDQDFLADMLIKSGYLVLVAGSKEKSVSIATSRIPDIIILYANLPDMDSFKIFTELKQNPKTNNIPIIFMVLEDHSKTIDSIFDKVEALTSASESASTTNVTEISSIADVITKPLNKHLVLARIKIQLQLKAALDKIEQMAYFDTLSGLPNKNYFNMFADMEWKKAIRDNTEISMILIDIDHFKEYNDTYGHIEGDNCIFKVSTALKNCVHRTSDFVARFGGEEFVCVLPNTDLDGALKVAENMRKRVEMLKIENFNSSINEYVTISLGVSSYIPDQSSNLLLFINKVDKALYNAKEEGRNKLCYL